jgi:Recombinase zinc beta ribbon domain/Recombinase
MAAGRLAKAARGELAVPLPAGYVRRPSGEAALDPDEQVQAVVRLIFDLFGQLGTVRGVLGFLVGHQVQIGMRARVGPAKGEVVWRRPHQTGIQNMLRNPAYAGIYAYGRTRFDPSRKIPGHPHTGRRRTAAGEWLVTIPGLLPAYITVGQYERNLARMQDNRARAEAAGAPRQGQALLAGLLVCGICHRRMGVTYETNRRGLIHRYVCLREHQSYGTQRCQQMAGAFLDAHVTGQGSGCFGPGRAGIVGARGRAGRTAPGGGGSHLAAAPGAGRSGM